MQSVLQKHAARQLNAAPAKSEEVLSQGEKAQATNTIACLGRVHPDWRQSQLERWLGRPLVSYKPLRVKETGIDIHRRVRVRIFVVRKP